MCFYSILYPFLSKCGDFWPEMWNCFIASFTLYVTCHHSLLGNYLLYIFQWSFSVL